MPTIARRSLGVAIMLMYIYIADSLCAYLVTLSAFLELPSNSDRLIELEQLGIRLDFTRRAVNKGYVTQLVCKQALFTLMVHCHS